MEIGESFFGKKHGKLAHLWNLAPKIIQCGPLKGILVCLSWFLTCEILIIKGQGHLDLHLGHEPCSLDDVPPLFQTSWKSDISFGGTWLFHGGHSISLLAPLEATFYSSGAWCHTWRTRAWWYWMIWWWIGMFGWRKTFSLEDIASGGLMSPSRSSTTWSLCQNITPKGNDVII